MNMALTVCRDPAAWSAIAGVSTRRGEGLMPILAAMLKASGKAITAAASP
jgi:hypothetical protein